MQSCHNPDAACVQVAAYARQHKSQVHMQSCHDPDADVVQVAAYARQHRYLQQEYDTAAMRLQAVERILKQYQCGTSEELLSETSNAQADLDRYYEIAGRGASPKQM